ncbi:hypothetical protein [Micromonospora sp. NPDC049497]|uniref:hypothetical protein n=1 Tax=Micromonospora sp. NPDC049497 TaxID=3364273 RepID=UPI0037AD78CF
MIITSPERIMVAMWSAACGVMWCNRPLWLSFKPWPRCWLPGGATIAGYGTSCACWSLSYYRSERHLDDVTAFLRSILSSEASSESRANDLHWLTRIAESVADPGYPT